jgi:hypothetical protein
MPSPYEEYRRAMICRYWAYTAEAFPGGDAPLGDVTPNSTARRFSRRHRPLETSSRHRASGRPRSGRSNG